MMLSLHRLSIVSLMACAALAGQEAEAVISPTPRVTVAPSVSMMTTDFVRVTAPWITFPIDSSPVTCEVGKHVMLIQENDEFFIAMCSNAYEGVFLAAFPVSTREGRPAWTTPEQKVFFAYRTSSCRGRLYFKRGDELPVDAETRSEYKLRIERFDHAFPLYLSKTNGGVVFAKAPPPNPAQIALAKTAQKSAAATVQKSSAAPAQRSPAASTPRLPPVKRYIVTPVGPSTNVFTIAMLDQTATTTPDKNDGGNSAGLFNRLFSRNEKPGTSAAKPEPPPKATSVVVAAAAPRTNAPAIVPTAGAQAKPAGMMARLPGFRTTIIILTAFVLFVVGLFWENRRKARQRHIAMEAAAKAVEAAAGGAGAPPISHGSSNDFSGSIASMSLGSVTQFLNSDKETGTLYVKDKSNVELGTLVFVKGEIIDAKSPKKRGIDALYEVLRNKEGFFSFLREEPAGVEKTITQGTISILLDAHRIMDEEHMPPVPAPPPVPTATPAAKAAARQSAPKTATRLKLHGTR